MQMLKKELGNWLANTVRNRLLTSAQNPTEAETMAPKVSRPLRRQQKRHQTAGAFRVGDQIQETNTRQNNCISRLRSRCHMPTPQIDLHL